MTAVRQGGPRAVTLREVAAHAGVSVATASQALAGRGRMTSATRERVGRSAETLGYVPNALARGLRTGRTHAIGVHHQNAAQALGTSYFRDFLAGTIEAAHAHDHDVAVLSSNTAEPRRTAPRVDGVIVTDPISDDTRARELMESRLPVVAGEHLPAGLPPSAVVAVDHAAAVREILDDASRRGARVPLLVAPDANSGWGDLLRSTVAAWCANRGLAPVQVESRFGDVAVDDHRHRLAPVLAGRPDVDLVLASSSWEALGALAALRAAGREPGRDVLLAACADTPALSDGDVAVTAVELPALALGRACAERLLELLEDDGGPHAGAGTVLTVPTVVHHRASTACLLRH
ncbi:LacI family DNA-binding transcriptional regulator [Cellulosimicrobium sp. BIT-GX5]|uniref:LacI family DNA-binding transcriptional regulator n=1 Tax=Cellulosimicrobium composti TaxID=2672572 RepID=A0A6N7ZJA0_9MICO|nr:LacI family DNA-binding transcriptional regulator [Cellulosimicrobium composti]MTG89410.1 LacI family DNA-binding transcriptional regulator [Cellulosimicrobium composti]